MDPIPYLSESVPVVGVTLATKPNVFVMRCPYCGMLHDHYAGPPAGTDDDRSLGHRDAPCDGDYGQQRGYELEWFGQKIRRSPQSRRTLNGTEHEVLAARVKQSGIVPIAKAIGISAGSLDQAFARLVLLPDDFTKMEGRHPDNRRDIVDDDTWMKHRAPGSHLILCHRQQRVWNTAYYAKIRAYLRSMSNTG